MLYFALSYSRVHYGIVSWGTAAKTYLITIRTKINQVLRAISFRNIQTPVTSLIMQKPQLLKTRYI